MAIQSTKRVLCYIRPWSVEQFDILARVAFPGAQVTTVSDHRGLGDICLSDEFYAWLERPGVEKEGARLVTEAEKDDIISRCRLLRVLPRARAERLLSAMAVAIDQALENSRPDYILSYTVDAYVLDLLLHLGSKRGVPFIGLAAIFANGYFRVTARGEYNKTGDSDAAAVNNVLDELLRTDYKPVYISVGPHGIHSDRGLYVRSVERWAKNFLRIGYFELKRLFGRDRSNFHYIGTLAAARTWLQPLPSFSWTRDWQARFAHHKGRRFYVPLQWTPESSIDYWCPHIEAIDYDSRIPEVVAVASSHGQVVVKEHPAFWGYRLSRFYRRLESDKVIIPPANASSIALIASSDWVIVYTGSAGFEAALRGKQVVTLGNPYYRSGRFIHAINDVNELEHLLADDTKPVPITRQEQFAMMKHVLDGALPGRFRDDGSFEPGNPEHIREAEGVAESLRTYIQAGPAIWRQAGPETHATGLLQ